MEPLLEGRILAGEFNNFLGNDSTKESGHRTDGAVSKPDDFAGNISIKFFDVEVALGFLTFVQGFASIHYLLDVGFV